MTVLDEREAVGADPDSGWRPWRVPGTSGFEVRNPSGSVGLIQKDRTEFLVENTFRFAAGPVTQEMTDRLVRNGKTRDQARRDVDDARTFTPTDENPTDLASVPRYMRWFETSYGAHTLAAIIHDNLIGETPNGAPLHDDTMADRFFRQMMKAAGVKWLKRWIMWSAVALRTRWAVKGIRRVSVLAWIALAAMGITSLAWAAGAAALGWGAPLDAWAMVLLAVALPFAAAALWGKQYGAGIVGAIAALWILPAAALAGLGYLVYLGLEKVAHGIGLD